MEARTNTGVKSQIKQAYKMLRHAPLIGSLIQFSWDTINLPRKTRMTQHELGQLKNTLPQQFSDIQHQLLHLEEKIKSATQTSLDGSMDAMKQLLNITAFYQPLHGYLQIEKTEPQRPCTDRADVIHHYLRDMGPTSMLDVGCSFGYFAYYFAARGYYVDAIDFDQNCVNICDFLLKFNPKNQPNFAKATFDLDYIEKIQAEKFDIALVLSVLHHITSEKGVPYVQQMMQTLLEKIPVVIIELALREEDVPFPWKDRLPENELEIFATCKDIEIEKLGCFSTHLSTIKRPLYVIRKKNMMINNHQYEIIKRRFIAHEDAHHFFRAFYETPNAFIKNYRLKHGGVSLDASKSEMLNEIAVYQKLPENTYFPKMLDQAHDEHTVKLVLSKLPGATLKHCLEKNDMQLDATQIVKSLLSAIQLLRNTGYYHNDIRTWNIMIDHHNTYLFDLGRADTQEHENTVTALLWIIYQLQHKRSMNYLKTEYPLSNKPEICLEKLGPELRNITQQLMNASNIDAFFAKQEN